MPTRRRFEVATLTVLMGIPGAGKTRWATHHAGTSTVLTLDVLRANRRLRTSDVLDRIEQDTAADLAAGIDVVIDACSTQPHLRARWLGVARSARATTRLVVVHADTEQAAWRQQSRRVWDRVPAEVIRAQAAAMQAALAVVSSEGWDAVLHVGEQPTSSGAGAASRQW